ncbi:hypothetical protein FVE85_0439 [Porphyridium purpureum]|uniref:Small multi-drug export protein n=1 Tax=Porphyridium purpureum TaxID=35688 RepID=A0A5J4Z0B0_PORPP|nr:hypothetical protein FVE85_0439 [Porphyridium purpureum]|eukprot:POR5763..scf208_2
MAFASYPLLPGFARISQGVNRAPQFLNPEATSRGLRGRHPGLRACVHAPGRHASALEIPDEFRATGAPDDAQAPQCTKTRPLLIVGLVLCLCVVFSVLLGAPQWVQAAASESSAIGRKTKHVGQKIAEVLADRGVPREMALLFLSSLPVIELRGGVPVGFWMGMHPGYVLLLCVLGNFLPMLPFLHLLRNQYVESALAPFLSRARSMVGEVKDAASPLVALAIFVGIPLPGTGAWTGAIIAHLLGFSVLNTAAALLAGILMSGTIMIALCTMGKYGALIAAIVCIAPALAWLLKQLSGSRTGSVHTAGHDHSQI